MSFSHLGTHSHLHKYIYQTRDSSQGCYTWYPQDFVTKIHMTNINMRSNPVMGYFSWTYRFYTEKIIYMLNDRLTYTNFEHINPCPMLISLPMDGKHNDSHKTNSFEVVNLTRSSFLLLLLIQQHPQIQINMQLHHCV